MHWKPNVDKLILAWLANRTPPSCIRVNIVSMALECEYTLVCSDHCSEDASTNMCLGIHLQPNEQEDDIGIFMKLVQRTRTL